MERWVRAEVEMRAGLWMTALGMFACASVDPESIADAPHAHVDAIFPASPETTPVPLKSAEYPNARFRQARYYTPGRSRAVDTIVLHVTQAPYEDVLSWFRNPENPYRTSAHYVVRREDGEITQLVRESDTAHHVRGFNGRSLGVEHEGFRSEPDTYTEATYRSSAALVRYLCRKYQLPMDREHIKDHAEVDPQNAGLGTGWDWTYFLALVRDGEGAPLPPGAAVPSGSGSCAAGVWTCDIQRQARVRCEDGTPVEQLPCTAGCQVMPVGVDDVCRPGAVGAVDHGACTAGGIPGSCLAESDCDGVVTSGLCRGPGTVACCTPTAPNVDPDPGDPEPSTDGQPCRVDGRIGICTDVERSDRCGPPAGLVFTQSCGGSAACCVDVSRSEIPPEDPPADPPEEQPPEDPPVERPPVEDPPAEDPPEERPPEDFPPEGEGESNIGIACRLFETDGECMTVEAAFAACPWPAKQGWPSATCGDGLLCCIEAPEQADPPPAEDPPPRAIPIDECQVGGSNGLCLSTADCRSEGGSSTAGHCPGPNDIQCCTW